MREDFANNADFIPCGALDFLGKIQIPDVNGSQLQNSEIDRTESNLGARADYFLFESECLEEPDFDTDDEDFDSDTFCFSRSIRYNGDIFHKPWIAQLDMMGLSKFVITFFEAELFPEPDDCSQYTTEEERNFRAKFCSLSDKDLRMLGFQDRHIAKFRKFFNRNGDIAYQRPRKPRFAEGPEKIVRKCGLDVFRCITPEERKFEITVNKPGYDLLQDSSDPGFYRTHDLLDDVKHWIYRRKFRRRVWSMFWIRQRDWYENLYYVDSLTEKQLALDVHSTLRAKLNKPIFSSTIFSFTTLEVIASYVPLVRYVPLLRFTSQWDTCMLIAQESVELWEHQNIDEELRALGIRKWCLIDALENPRSGFFMTQFLHDYRDQRLEIQNQILVKEILWTPRQTRICEVPTKDTPRKLFD